MASEYPLVTDQGPRGEPKATQEEGLPPGVERTPTGQLIRRVMVSSMDGSEREQVRPVVLTLAEAKATRKDYYHPTLGWMRYGYKFERDRPPEDLMADGSIASPDPSLIGKE